MKKALLLFAISAAMASCTHSDELEYSAAVECNETIGAASGALTKATGESDDWGADYEGGKKLRVPYSLSVMREACQNYWDMRSHFDYPGALIFDTTIGMTIMPLRPDEIEARFNHVKFTFTDIESYNELMGFYTEMEFSDKPFDFEPEGVGEVWARSFYHAGDHITVDPDSASFDEDAEEIEFRGSVWALVPTDMPLPSSVHHQIVDQWVYTDEHYLPDDIDPDFMDFVFLEACYLTSNPDLVFVERQSHWQPSGRIRAWDDYLEDWVPLEGARIEIRGMNGKKDIVKTNSDGYFCSSVTFFHAVRYILSFEGDNFQIRLTYNDSVSGVVGCQSKFSYNDISWDIDKDFSVDIRYPLLPCATIYRATSGIFTNPEINSGFVFTKPTGEEKLQMYYSPNPSPANNNGEYVFTGINIYPQKYTSRILSTTYHEIAHWIHDKNCEVEFRSMEQIIVESWARFVQHICTLREYAMLGRPLMEFVRIIPGIRDPEVFGIHLHVEYKNTTSIYYTNLQFEWNSDTWEVEGHILKNYTPLFQDLYDNFNQRYSKTINNNEKADLFPNDWIAIRDISAIQYLANNVRNLKELKAKLRREFIGRGIENDDVLNAYFSFYGL